MIKQANTFFRVFDLAFFAPGAFIIAVLANCGLTLPGFKEKLSTAGEIIALLSGIAALYTLGLVVHALVWLSFNKWGKSWKEKIKKEIENEDAEWIPFPLRFENAVRDELILYFWYLRATCWNMATAILIAIPLIVTFCASTEPWWLYLIVTTVIGLSCSILLFHLGGVYHRSMTRSIMKKNQESGEGKEPQK